MQFAILSDQNATDFAGRASAPIFRDPSPGRTAWTEMQSGAVKHDTFVFSRDGVRVLFWDTSAESLGAWAADIRAAVVAQGK